MDAKGLRSPNRLKQKLAAGEVCIGATITMNSPVVAELFSRLGFDWLWLEMEHTTMADADVLGMLQAANGSETSMVVRAPWNDKTMIKRILDTGPDAILIPLVNSAEEAEAAVRAIKYPPVGERGAGLGRAQCYGLHMGEYLQTANDEVITLVMIEHVEAVKNIEAILAVEGVELGDGWSAGSVGQHGIARPDRPPSRRGGDSDGPALRQGGGQAVRDRCRQPGANQPPNQRGLHQRDPRPRHSLFARRRHRGFGQGRSNTRVMG